MSGNDNYFETQAKTYSDRYEKFTWNIYEKIYQRRRLNIALSYAETGAAQDILDAGCASGALLKELADTMGNEKEFSLSGFDQSEALIAIAKAKHIRNSTFFQADIINSNVPSKSYDLIYCLGVMPYLPDIPSALAELHRLLRDDGACIVTYPYRNMVVDFLRTTRTGLFIRKHILNMAAFSVQYSISEFENICTDTGFKIQEARKLPFSEYLFKLGN